MHPSGQGFLPRLEPGLELRWGRLAGRACACRPAFDQSRYFVYQDPTCDWHTFDLERDATKANSANKGIREMDPHLAAYAKHGGKLILYHDWPNQPVVEGSAIEFYCSHVPCGATSK